MLAHPHLVELTFIGKLMSANPSEGVFYLVRLPDGWQLCTFRRDEYGSIGLPDCWVEVLNAFLNIWLAHFEKLAPEELLERQMDIEKAIGQLVASYDVFPRGEVKRRDGHRRFTVSHGGEIARGMHITHREIEEAFGIQGHAKWVVDSKFYSDPRAAKRLRSLLSFEEIWENHPKREKA
jgi:hypothetical protein